MRGTRIVIAVAIGLGVASAGCKKGGGAGKAGEGSSKTAIPIPLNGPGTGSAAQPAPGGPLDPQAFGAALNFDQVAEHLFDRPDVDKAFDELMDAVFADPQLAAFGADLMSQLGDDPAIAQGMTAITDAIASDPAVLARLQAMIKSKPNITQDEITVMITSEFTRAYEAMLAKPVERGVEAAIDGLNLSKESATLFAALGSTLEASVAGYLSDPDRLSKWNARLTELNGGQPATITTAADLFMKHALTEDRLAKYMITVLAQPETRSEVARFFGVLGKSKGVQAALVDGARALASSEDVQHKAAAALISALDPKTTPGIASKKVDALFASPAIHDGMDTVIRAILTEPTMPTAIDDSLRRLWAVPAVKTATDQLLDGW
jgi:hypothetical protein